MLGLFLTYETVKLDRQIYSHTWAILFEALIQPMIHDTLEDAIQDSIKNYEKT